MSEFRGKTVLITGSGRGIGRDTALAFGAEGANLCVNYAHSAAAAKQTVAEIEALGGKAIACETDIADSVQVDAMVAATLDAFGAIDILVNNAGLSIDGPFLEMQEQDWDRVYEVNLKGAFLVSQAVARQMSAGKAGLNMLTKCMALELGPGIRVNGVGLGFVDSPLVRELYSSEPIDQVIDGTPLKRMTSNAETASFIRLLASESTSFVTGQTIMFDGGRNMR